MEEVPFRPFEGDYEKQWYEVRLPDGEILLCWPNAGKMIAIDGSGGEWSPSDGIEYRETLRNPSTEPIDGIMTNLAIATKNLERLIARLNIPGVEYTHYPSYDDDGMCYFVLKRKDPRPSTLKGVLLTEGIAVPSWGLYDDNDKIDGRLTKLWLPRSGGWLPSLALRWIRETLDPKAST